MRNYYLVDMLNLIFRAHYAIYPPMHNPQGRISNAVYYFLHWMRRLIIQDPAACLIFCFDAPHPSFRKALFPSYKANRSHPPEDLGEQIVIIQQLIRTMDLEYCEIMGYEADDLIASFVHQLASSDKKIYIISQDKDLGQLLVYPNTFLLQNQKKNNLREVNQGNFCQFYPVEAHQIRDYLALIGDSSDNIPGVKGIGPKTAQSLINQYGSLDNIYAHIDEITLSCQKKLNENKEMAQLSYSLITLKYDAPIKDTQEKFYFHPELLEKNHIIFEKILIKEGMHRILEQYRSSFFIKNKEEANISFSQEPYHCVSSLKIFLILLRKIINEQYCTLFPSQLTKVVSSQRLVGLVFRLKEEIYYLPIHSAASQSISMLHIRRLLTYLCHHKQVNLIIYHANEFFKLLNLYSSSQKYALYFDILIAAWILNPESQYSLSYLSSAYLETAIPTYPLSKGSTDNLSRLDWENLETYAIRMVEFIYQLYLALDNKIKENEWETIFFHVEMPIQALLLQMQDEGILIDQTKLAVYADKLKYLKHNLSEDIYRIVGHQFNISSSQQLQKVLFEELNLSYSIKNKTGYSTKAEVLENLRDKHPIIEMILSYRSVTKMYSTYIKEFISFINPDTQRIHTEFQQTGTATGRLSSRQPNMQNIPLEDPFLAQNDINIRSLFKAKDEYVLMSADYSQIELVILAHLSEDKHLCAAYREGKDIHRQTASFLFHCPLDSVNAEERQLAKMINFGIIYQMSAFRLSQILRISLSKAQEFIQKYFKIYESIASYIEKTLQEAKEKHYVSTLLGRKRFLANINSLNKIERQASERIAINTPIQGSSSDIMKLAMLKIQKKLIQNSLKARLILQIHDELIFEVHQSEISLLSQILKDSMENAFSLRIPLRINLSYGKYWSDLK